MKLTRFHQGQTNIYRFLDVSQRDKQENNRVYTKQSAPVNKRLRADCITGLHALGVITLIASKFDILRCNLRGPSFDPVRLAHVRLLRYLITLCNIVFVLVTLHY